MAFTKKHYELLADTMRGLKPDPYAQPDVFDFWAKSVGRFVGMFTRDNPNFKPKEFLSRLFDQEGD